MNWQEIAVLDELGFSVYDKKALVTLAILGVADAAGLCREGEIPTSKIYSSMEKLARLGLARIQPSRPKMYASLPAEVVVNRLMQIARDRAERFAAEAQGLKKTLASLPGRLRGRQTFIDLALGVESHVKRHLVRLSAASKRILSHMEEGDLTAIERVTDGGFPVMHRIGRNTQERKIDHRVVFGFSHRSAPRLVEFLRKYRADLHGLTGVRYSGEFGHPFHVVDEDVVILSLDHPFVPEGRFASLLIQDKELAHSLTDGFETLWLKAMKSLTEIDFHPAASGASRQ